MKQRQRSGLVGAILVGFCACSSGVPSVDAQAPAGVQKAVVSISIRANARLA